MDRSTRLRRAIELELEIRNRMRRLGQQLRACDPSLAGMLEDIAVEAEGHVRFLEAARDGAMEEAAVEFYGGRPSSARTTAPVA